MARLGQVFSLLALTSYKLIYEESILSSPPKVRFGTGLLRKEGINLAEGE